MSTAGGRTAGYSEYRTHTFTKLVNMASPVLMQHCSMGKTIPKAS
jgi:type VI secretion system secreted protein Hcp